MEFLFLFAGLAGLWIGSELTIQGALSIAERHKISQLFIGLTILAFGTDLPELFVIITAAIQKLGGTDTSDLIVGETIGTSMAQIALVLGIASLIATISITKRELMRDGLTMLGAIILMGILGLDGEISQADGFVLMLVYGIYFVTLIREEKMKKFSLGGEKNHLLWAGLSIAGGIGLLLIGSHLTVENALKISEAFGIGQHVVGILVVGLGTSLPELATAITAMRKGAGTMAVGNVIGSNIFDLLFALGIGSAISGFTFRSSLLWIDLPLLFAVCLITLVLFRSKMELSKKEGLILLGMFLLYFGLRIFGILPE